MSGRFYIRHGEFLYAYDIRARVPEPEKLQERFEG